VSCSFLYLFGGRQIKYSAKVTCANDGSRTGWQVTFFTGQLLAYFPYLQIYHLWLHSLYILSYACSYFIDNLIFRCSSAGDEACHWWWWYTKHQFKRTQSIWCSKKTLRSCGQWYSTFSWCTQYCEFRTKWEKDWKEEQRSKFCVSYRQECK